MDCLSVRLSINKSNSLHFSRNGMPIFLSSSAYLERKSGIFLKTCQPPNFERGVGAPTLGRLGVDVTIYAVGDGRRWIGIVTIM